jgi:antitoxin component of RelBE/YafQ-DinJ toxin-antitoxin module
MKIIEVPQFGPMFRFSDANIYWALHLLSDGRRVGRKKLAEMVGIGEGSMRRIVDTLKEWSFVNVKQTGITITRAGQTFLSKTPIRVVEVDIGESTVGAYSQSVLVMGVSDKVYNGMQQRDAGIKVGATGCTTIVIRDGNLMIPPDWNIDERNPDLAYKIRKETGITQSDAIIVGSADTKALAVEAAINAAFELI